MKIRTQNLQYYMFDHIYWHNNQVQYNTFRGIVTGISERLSILYKFIKQAFIKDLTHFTITQTFYKTEHECNIKPLNQIRTAKVTAN